jgi:hypothetical protein
VRGFDLDDQEALDVLTDWNNQCAPPWSDRELLHKIQDARTKGQSPEIGEFLDQNRNASRRVRLSPEEIELIRKARAK